MCKDKASEITRNINMNFISELLFDAIDKATPLINKHPKVGKAILTSSEKLIRFTGNFSK